MAWGSPDATRRRIQADNTIAYSTGTSTLSIQHVGLLKELMFRDRSGTITYTKSGGGSAKDQMGPFNSLTNINVKVNGIGTFLDAPAWMLYLYNLIHYAKNNFDPSSPENASILQTQTATNIFEFDTVPGSSGSVVNLWALRFPFTVEILGVKEVGLWVLQNDEVNLQVTPTWNSVNASTTALVAPYDIAGGDTFSAPSTTNTALDIVRTFYAVPSNKSDYPVVGWFHQVETQQVPMTSTTTEIAHPKGGIILRSIYQCVNGTTPSLYTSAGVSGSGVNRLQWLYGSNETPYDESDLDVLNRQRTLYGHDLPIGVYVHDFFGMGNQTLRDTYDTAKYQNLRTHIVTSSTPPAGSYVLCTRERLIPIGTQAEPLY